MNCYLEYVINNVILIFHISFLRVYEEITLLSNAFEWHQLHEEFSTIFMQITRVSL